MSDEEGTEVDQSLVLVGYAQVMFSFQMLELALWGARALKLKGNSTFKHMMSQVEKWDRNTLGALLSSIQGDPAWPDRIKDEITGLLQERNYLAHSFLRVYFVHVPSDEDRDRAVEILVDLDNRIDACRGHIEEHLQTLGMPSLDDLDPGILADIDALQPRNWGCGL